MSAEGVYESKRPPPTVVYFQSTPNHSWPTNVLCNAKKIFGTPLHALTIERRDPNTYLGLEARLNTITAGGFGPPGQFQRTLGFRIGMPTGAGFVAASLGAALGFLG